MAASPLPPRRNEKPSWSNSADFALKLEPTRLANRLEKLFG